MGLAMENPILFTRSKLRLLGLHVSANAEMVNIFGTPCRRFNDFGSEYRALRRAVALVDSNSRALLSFRTGPATYLNAVLTSNVRDLKAGKNRRLLLTPQGTFSRSRNFGARWGRILALSHRWCAIAFSTLDKFIIMDDDPETGRLPRNARSPGAARR